MIFPTRSLHLVFGLCVSIFLSVLSFNTSAQEKSITINMKSNVQTDYMNGLLKLALSYSGKDYVYQSTSEVYSRPRLMESVKNGSVSVMWGGTSEQMEKDFIPIRIDAYRGLMNHRLLFIRKGDQPRFERIRSHAVASLASGNNRQTGRWRRTPVRRLAARRAAGSRARRQTRAPP